MPKRDEFMGMLHAVCERFEDDVKDVNNVPDVPDVPGSVRVISG